MPPRKKIRPECLRGLARLGGKHVKYPSSDNIAAFLSEEECCGRVSVYKYSVIARNKESIQRLFEESTQLIFLPLAFGEVNGDREYRPRVTVPIAEKGEAAVRPNHLAVGPNVTLVKGDGAARLDGLLQGV
jgi:hypothetical protein